MIEEAAMCDGMEAALHYYNQLPPSVFASPRDASAPASCSSRESDVADDTRYTL